MTHICVSKPIIIGSDHGLKPDRRHYLNQCWSIVNWTIGNNVPWNLHRNLYISIQENAFENVVILSRPQCVKGVIFHKSRYPKTRQKNRKDVDTDGIIKHVNKLMTRQIRWGKRIKQIVLFLQSLHHPMALREATLLGAVTTETFYLKFPSVSWSLSNIAKVFYRNRTQYSMCWCVWYC